MKKIIMVGLMILSMGFAYEVNPTTEDYQIDCENYSKKDLQVVRNSALELMNDYDKENYQMTSKVIEKIIRQNKTNIAEIEYSANTKEGCLAMKTAINGATDIVVILKNFIEERYGVYRAENELDKIVDKFNVDKEKHLLILESKAKVE